MQFKGCRVADKTCKSACWHVCFFSFSQISDIQPCYDKFKPPKQLTYIFPVPTVFSPEYNI